MFAARVGDMHLCPMITPGAPPVPHVGGPILPPGVPQVLIGKLPAAPIGNMCTCVGPPDSIVMGAPNVMVSKRPLARMSSTTAHGGTVIIGCATVLVGSGAASALAAGGSFEIPSMPDPSQMTQMMSEREAIADSVAENIDNLQNQLADADSQDEIDAINAQIAEQEARLAV